MVAGTSYVADMLLAAGVHTIDVQALDSAGHTSPAAHGQLRIVSRDPYVVSGSGIYDAINYPADPNLNDNPLVACRIAAGGVVHCWGGNNAGALGSGNANSWGQVANSNVTEAPIINLGAGRTAVAIAMSAWSVCALLDNNQVKWWGSGIGDMPNQMGDQLAAESIHHSTPIVRINSGGDYRVDLLEDGGVVANLLSHEAYPSPYSVYTPPGPDSIVDVDCVYVTGCAVTRAGALRCWGDDRFNAAVGGGMALNLNPNTEYSLIADAFDPNYVPIDFNTNAKVLLAQTTTHTTCALFADRTLRYTYENGSTGVMPFVGGHFPVAFGLPGELYGAPYVAAIMENGEVQISPTDFSSVVHPLPGRSAKHIAAASWASPDC